MINSFFGRTAVLSVSEHVVCGGARNPHVPEVRPKVLRFVRLAHCPENLNL